MAGLKPLVGGATAHIAQSISNIESSFALKHIQFPDSDHPKESDIIRVATVELMVLTHPAVKNHSNILALEGATWDFSDSSRPVRPVLVTEKSIGKPWHILLRIRARSGSREPSGDFEQEVSHVDLPISTPWHAPELDDNQFGLSVLEAKRADIYSVGLVCLWLVVGKGTAKPVDNLCSGGYESVGELKRDMGISSFIALNLQELSDVDEGMKSNLEIFFRLTTSVEVEERIPTLAKFVEAPPISMNCPINNILPMFSVSNIRSEPGNFH
ncbi:MAG: hypothetical protein L6R42_001030 [Xanthoria sp. 1 TBL-2021]|nr:MAG: hypothetical protein L6R42_001030 [Xanthoria sp. 1 TBL-2021]